MKAILIPFLMWSPILCQTDWCSLVKPKGTYDGLDLYVRFGITNWMDQIVMSNRVGDEWLLSYETQVRSGHISLKLTPIEKSLNKTKDLDVVHRFGITYSRKRYNCEVRHLTDSRFNINCEGFVDRGITQHVVNSTFYDDILILPVPIGYAVLVFNRNAKEWYMAYNPMDSTLLKCHIQSKLPYCPVPTFVRQLNPSLFKRIGGVAYFNRKNLTGHLILFNVEGRPKYCFSEKDKDLSKECKSSTNMRLLFEECFKEKDINITSTQMVDISPNYWLIVILCAVLLMVVAVALTIWWFWPKIVICLQNKDEEQPKPTTPIKSSNIEKSVKKSPKRTGIKSGLTKKSKIVESGQSVRSNIKS